MPEESSAADLVALIKSMDMSERRYFRLQAEGMPGGEDKAYLRLYDHLLAEGRWDADALARAFPAAPFLRQPNVARHKLQQRILDALRDYHQGKTHDLDFSRRLDAITLLFQRKLWPACARAIKAAQRKAAAMELPEQELLILRHAARLERQRGGHDLPQRMARIHAREQVLIAQVQAERALTGTLDALMALLPPHGPALDQARAQADALLQQPALLSPDPGFDGRVTRHYIHAYHGYLKADLAAFLQGQQAIAAEWDANPERMRQEQERHFKMLTGLVQACWAANRHAEVPKVIARMQRILQRSAALARTEQPRLLMLELTHHIATEDWTRASALAPQAWQALQHPKPTLNAAVRQGLLSNLLGLHVQLRQWPDAIQAASRLARSEGVSGLLAEWARACQWAAWYSLGEHEALEKDIRQARPAVGEDLVSAFSALLAATSAPAEAQALAAVHAAAQTPGRARIFGVLAHWAG